MTGRGGLHFQAAGNDAADISAWPDYASFLLVGATDRADALASFSNRGVPVDLVAPGVEILSTYRQGQYAYAWDFGDGQGAAGCQASHTYALPGAYTATLTVTDDQGATASATVAIQANDPAALAAPSGLAAAAAGATVTLRWTDNSGNEDGFAVERAAKVKGKFVFVEVGRVGANVTAFSESPGAGSYRYRVRAFNATRYSAYSGTAAVDVGPAAKAQTNGQPGC